MSGSTVKDTIPRVTHVSYFHSVMQGIAGGLTFDELRLRVRQVSSELNRRTGGSATTARIADAYTLWSPTADAISELMRLGLVERRPVPAKRTNVDAHRETKYHLTSSGQDVFSQSGENDSAFRGALTPLLIKQHPYLSTLCAALGEEPLLIPEYTEEELREFKQASESWTAVLGENAAVRMRQSMKRANASAEAVTAQVREALKKRFSGGAEPSPKDILDTVLDALIVAALEARGLRYDAITFNILTSWGRQLFVFDESRYVQAMNGRAVWSTAAIEGIGSETPSVTRRGLSQFGGKVAEQLATSYRDIAEALTADIGGSAVRFPYIGIYKVRALTAFRVGVNISLVDRVIAEIAERARQVPFSLELQLGTANWPFSEPPFRLGSRRYYVMLIKPEGDE